MTRKAQSTSLAILVVLTACCSVLSAQDWPRFRGPNGAGTGTIENLPDEWTDENVNWKVELPGTGHSSPIIWQERIYLTCTDEETAERIVCCLDAENGELLWTKSSSSQAHPQHNFNSYASGSAAVDESGVYFCWTTPQEFTVVAFSHDGEERWRENLGPFVAQHGGGISPTVHDGRVFVFVDTDANGGSGSFLAALDAASGETIWKTSHESSVSNYSTPLIFQPNEDTTPLVIINSMAQGMTAYDFADGKVAWQLADSGNQPLLSLRSVSSPYLAGDLLIASCGVGGGGGNSLVAVKPPADRDGAPQVAYRIGRSAPYVPTSVFRNGLLFLVDDAGVGTCVDAASGEVHWRQRLGGGFFASPVASDDRIFAVTTEGEVLVLDASSEFNVLARNRLEELCHATPAIADGRLYLRTYRHLYSLGGE